MKSTLLVKKLLGLDEMTSGLVNASFSLPEWQAVKMIFFAPCIRGMGRVLEISSRKYGRVRNISEIKANNKPVSSAAEMAEVLNDIFCNYWINFGK